MLFYVLVISQSLVVINTPYTNPQSRARGGVASPVAPPSSSQPDLVLLRAWAHILQPSPGSDFPGTKAGKEPVKETAGQEKGERRPCTSITKSKLLLLPRKEVKKST